MNPKPSGQEQIAQLYSTGEEIGVQGPVNTFPWSCLNQNLHKRVYMVLKYHTGFGIIITLEGNKVIPEGSMYQLIC